MSESMKLTDAIAAMENGIKRLKREADQLSANINKAQTRLTLVQEEARLRLDVYDAMKRLQEGLPKDETIRFVIPSQDD